jgi:hypothetical protein
VDHCGIEEILEHALLADPEQVERAMQGLGGLVAPDGNVNDPLLTFSVSNLVVAS